jgi:hypothetical protein
VSFHTTLRPGLPCTLSRRTTARLPSVERLPNSVTVAFGSSRNRRYTKCDTQSVAPSAASLCNHAPQLGSATQVFRTPPSSQPQIVVSLRTARSRQGSRAPSPFVMALLVVHDALIGQWQAQHSSHLWLGKPTRNPRCPRRCLSSPLNALLASVPTSHEMVPMGTLLRAARKCKSSPSALLGPNWSLARCRVTLLN